MKKFETYRFSCVGRQVSFSDVGDLSLNEGALMISVGDRKGARGTAHDYEPDTQLQLIIGDREIERFLDFLSGSRSVLVEKFIKRVTER